MFVRSPYNYDAMQASDESGVSFVGEVSLTKQSFKDECDINVIVRRFGLTGEIPGDFQTPVSGDFRGLPDFRGALDMVRAAEAAFLELPAELRKRFGHDPQQLMEFLEDGRNKDEAIKLGLISAPAVAERSVVQAVDELAAKLVQPKA